LSNWSPKGDAVLAASDYLSPHKSLALFPVDAAPSAEKAATVVVSDPAYNVWQGNYSPNGRWLAFVAQSLPNGRTTVEIVSSAGGPTTPTPAVVAELAIPARARTMTT
jgi:hypothetical protein